MAKQSDARAKLDAFGVDAVCAAIAETKSLTDIAKSLKVGIGTLLSWIEADPDRSACVREARAMTAALWDERAAQRIEQASDEFDLKKAREIAHHYRWRAAKIAPRSYGDKVQTEHSGSVAYTNMTDAEIEARIKLLSGA